MMSRGLINRIATEAGLSYQADDNAGPFLDALSADYLTELKERSTWVISTFGQMSNVNIRHALSKIYDQWTREFQVHERPGIKA